MLKSVLLGQWYGYSDSQLEEQLKVRLDFMDFCGFGLYGDTPDETTINRFRNTLISMGLLKKILIVINNQLEERSLKIKNAEINVLDATIITSSARPRKTVNIETDREETTEKIDIEESKDKDARWIKKGKKCEFGFKCFAVVDKEGYYEQVHTESANEAEINKLDLFLANMDAEILLADKGYASDNNRQLLRSKGIKDGIMHKAVKNRELNPVQKFANRLISKVRYVVEQSFGTLKRVLKFSRASYLGKVKVNAQFTLKAICSNLLKATNKKQKFKILQLDCA